MRRHARAATAGSTSEHAGKAAALLCATTLLGLLVFFSASASAVHIFNSQFGSAGTGDGQLSNPRGVAVGQSSGDVYVADTGNARVEKFDSSGVFSLAFGADVGGAGVDTCSSGCVAGTPGSGPGEFESPTFVAVDDAPGPSQGDAYVADTATDLVQKFDPSGSLIASWGTGGQLDGSASPNGPFGPLAGIAVDSGGNLYAIDTNTRIFKFDEGGGFLEDFTTERATIPAGLAVDSTGDLFKVNESGSVEKFGPAGADIGEVSFALNAKGIAIDPASDDLYVDDGAAVDHFEFDGSGHVVEPGSSTCTPALFLGCAASDSFGSGNITNGAGLAIRGSSGDLYVADPGASAIDLFPPVLAAPTPGEPKVVSAGVSQADVKATVNPNYAATTYRFQYGPTASYGSETKEASLPADGQGHEVSAHLSGLVPGTEYHFRVVATNSIDTAEGADATFRTFEVPGPFELPDHRAYEMVSPVAKNGGDIVTAPWQTRSSVDGNTVEYPSLASFADAKGLTYQAQYVSRRTPEGWQTHSISPPQGANTEVLPNLFGKVPRYMGEFSADFSKGVLVTNRPLTDAPNVANVPNLYLNTNILTPGASHYELLSDCPGCTVPLQYGQYGDPGTVVAEETELAGASADFHHILFESRSALTADTTECADPEEGGNCPPMLYEWEDGTVRLVGQIPFSGTECGVGGPTCTPAESSVAAQGAAIVPVTNLGGGGLAPTGEGYTESMISDNGSRVFFTAPPFKAETGAVWAGNIYMRENHERTVQINAGQSLATLWTATPDGKKVFYTAEGNLYRYEPDKPAGEQRTLLSKGLEVLGTSADGEYVYFTSGESLVPGQPAPGSNEDAPAVYLWHTGAVQFIGINNEGATDLTIGALERANNVKVGGTDIRVTPSGSLLYATNTPQTSYDTRSGNCEGQRLKGRCVEIYLFNPAVGHVVCVSCNPTGAPPAGSASFKETSGALTTFHNQHISRAVIDNGSRVFFDSPDALVPQDSNGHIDAYEFEAETGKISLISTGQCACDSYFDEASPDGHDVFFTTPQQLVRIDSDRNVDIYDARVDGGIASQNALAPVECEGESCQSPAVPPIDPSPSSSTYSGPRNLATHHRKRRRHHRKGRHRKPRGPHASRRAANRDRGGAK